MLRNPRYNKGLAFTLAERKALKIEGLLPPYVIDQPLQVKRVLEQFRKLTTDLGQDARGGRCDARSHCGG